MRISDWSSDVCSSDLQRRPEMRRDRIVVEPDHRQVARNIEAALAGGVDHARRHFVVARKDRGRPRHQIEQELGGDDSRFDGVIPSAMKLRGSAISAASSASYKPRAEARRSGKEWVRELRNQGPP